MWSFRRLLRSISPHSSLMAVITFPLDQLLCQPLTLSLCLSNLCWSPLPNYNSSIPLPGSPSVIALVQTLLSLPILQTMQSISSVCIHCAFSNSCLQIDMRSWLASEDYLKNSYKLFLSHLRKFQCKFWWEGWNLSFELVSKVLWMHRQTWKAPDRRYGEMTTFTLM